MEDIEKIIEGLGIGELEGGQQGEALRSSAFLQLKSFCLELLELVRNPKKHASVIPAFRHFLQSSSSSTLQPFVDYTLFPLLLLLDAAIECRSMPKLDSTEKFTMSDVPKVPNRVSDIVAEGVVNCLEELLRKCHLKSVDQMVVLLKKLTYGALLSPSQASEELREGIILCFRALLLSLHSCSDESCLCEQIPGLPALSEDTDDAPLWKSFKSTAESEVCLLAFLRSQAASAAIGHWLSLLLKAADTEAARGHRGSARLRIEAFRTLRLLVAKVGTADALAFFLPGVVSQFAKVLHSAKTMMSGAAGSAEAIDQAIRGLTEYLMIVLTDDANAPILGIEPSSNSGSDSSVSTVSLLEELRCLPVKAQLQNEVIEDTRGKLGKIPCSKPDLQEMGSADCSKGIGSLHVNRTKDWLEKTSAHLKKLLTVTFPHICIHPSKKVRKGLVNAVQGLLLNCHYTLGESRLMLLECLCALVVDDYDDVSSTAQEFLEYLSSLNWEPPLEQDASEIFSRHVEKLPKVVLGNEESHAMLNAQQLLVIIYYSGPRLIVNQLQSPVGAARFLDVFAACLGHRSEFSGSLDKIISRSSTLGYLPSVDELKSGVNFLCHGLPIMNAGLLEAPKYSHIEENIGQKPTKAEGYELPRMPPWFGNVGSVKLYQSLARILRLVGLSLVADSRSEGLLSYVTETLLGYIRKLVSDLRMKDYNKESWQSWYERNGSGQLLRKASTAACMLNEIMFGLSDQAINDFARMFHRSATKREGVHAQSFKLDCALHESVWKMPQDEGVRSHLVDCIGGILHEYLSAEVWSVPVNYRSVEMRLNVEDEELSPYFFQDTAMLHEEIHISLLTVYLFSVICDFASSGFLHSSLYLLLENLSSPSFQVRNAADCVLHILSTTYGYSTVGQLVLENADYVVDSICRQLCHLDLNHHVPNVLASILSYIGVASKILPLLEEPMRSVSMELEILGRHQHPDLTIPFLKAVAEIAKASRQEACLLTPQAESFAVYVRSIISCAKEQKEDQWEAILFKLNDSRRYRRTVGSIASSCITTATPLIASLKQETCLAALDIIEGGMLALAEVEAAYKHERETKESMDEAVQSQSLYWLKDTLDAVEEGTDENRLLPAMNKIWPFLVACIRNKNPVAVRRCLNTISNLVLLCGGSFFTRRFLTDGTHFWKLLSMSPFHKKGNARDEKVRLQLPYRSSPIASEDSVAEGSSLKVQIAVLNMIADLCLDKRSASSLDSVLKKVSGLVVGMACSGVVGLREASLKALHGLASIDPDLVWLLLADVYYTMRKTETLAPPRSDLPHISEILPPPSSPKEYMYVQYGGQSYGFDLDFASVEVVFTKLFS
ncbi:uncharacterized protein LOC129311171 isoform X3 [Prosopis cineraria]|uniref:uncharacterized protein LOC129311171 isoform X3 n=1 Tax=Prosopis cineraria TaxID=364024 RepID=UPI00240F6FA1|nr:uncharacterized protein LOC129311171 isoform X3 [Prosopis cineraria]